MKPFDVIVVGGGPAGLTAAIAARLSGMTVLVLEPRPGSIDKACGEGLMPAAVAHLESLGVTLTESQPFRGIEYIDAQSGRVARGRFPQEPGLGVRRTTLHGALRQRAKELGVTRCHHRVRTVTQDAELVYADRFRARYLVAADGLHSAIRKQVGLEAERPSGHARYGTRRHYRVAPWSDSVQVYWSQRCEAYVTPVSKDTVGIAILHRKPAHFDELLTDFPQLEAQLGQPVNRRMGAGPFHQRTKGRVAGRVLLVGDAAGFLDPLTGEGIAIGVQTAIAAIKAIKAHKPLRYEASWKRITRTYYILTHMLLAVGRRPFLRRHLVGMASAFPGIFNLVLRLLAGRGQPVTSPMIELADPKRDAFELPKNTSQFTIG